MRKCSICKHEKIDEIDRKLGASKKIADIAREFSISPDALERHRKHRIKDNAEETPITADNAESQNSAISHDVQPTPEDIKLLQQAIPNFQGDLRTKSLCSCTNLSELTVVLAMIQLGYESVTLFNSNVEVWRPVGATTANRDDPLVRIVFLQNYTDRARGLQFGCQERARLRLSHVNDLIRAGVRMARME